MSFVLPRGAIAGIAATTVVVLSAGAANAACGPTSFTSPTLSAETTEWSIEGKISCAEADRPGVSGSITVNGVTVSVPAATSATDPNRVWLNTRDPRQGRKDVTLACLIDPRGADPYTGAPCFGSLIPIPARALSYIGATLKGDGPIVATASTTPGQDNVTLQAINGDPGAPGLTFEFAEHLVIGAFNYDDTGKMFINNQEFRMNDDPRMPFYSEVPGVVDDNILLDAAGRGDTITLADLKKPAQRGSLVAVVGYYAPDENGTNVLWGVEVETSVVKQGANADELSVKKSEYRTRTRVLRVDGSVVPMESQGTTPPPNVTIWIGEADAQGVKCTGSQLPLTGTVGAYDTVEQSAPFNYNRVLPAGLNMTLGMDLCVQSPRNGALTFQLGKLSR
jgi:hypothetical protein